MSTRQTTDDTRIESIKIGPDDPRYRAVVDKRFNKRFRASPDYVRLVSSTDEVVAAVAEETSDPNRDLWWAHTGGGGGNFGVVTRYWFRSPGARGPDPASLLPKAPNSVVAFRAAWRWEDIDEAAFARLVRNFGNWCERNRDADSPYAK